MAHPDPITHLYEFVLYHCALCAICLLCHPLKVVDRVIAIGPTIMMKFCSLTTQPFGVKTIASLNPIMVDGTGMCGCCRVEVGAETRFACVHGPEFDAHQVDWDLLMARQRIYLNREKEALRLWEEQAQSGGTIHG